MLLIDLGVLEPAVVDLLLFVAADPECGVVDLEPLDLEPLEFGVLEPAVVDLLLFVAGVPV
jgi:hypothetical protein